MVINDTAERMTNPFLSGAITSKVMQVKTVYLANMKALLMQVSEIKLFGIELGADCKSFFWKA